MRRTKWRYVIALIPLTLLALVLLESVFAKDVQGPSYTTAATDLPSDVLSNIVDDVANLEVAAIQYCDDAWFSAYVCSRIVEAAPGLSFDPTVAHEYVSPGTDSMTFGPWSAAKDYGATDAREDGSITEWADHYYITHQWSEYGQQILSMLPGDKVTVNGKSFIVQAIFDYPKDSFYEEIMRIVGDQSTVIQTCIPDADYNRIVFGW